MLSHYVLRASLRSRSNGLLSQLPPSIEHCVDQIWPNSHRNFHASSLVEASSSSTRWKKRQSTDSYAREAKVQGLKSRAAFKLLEIDAKYRIFKKGQTVVDLGYAPGSWSQVAVERTKPGGRIVGIDIIPAQPPKGVSTIQGNFLSSEVREVVKRFLSDPDRGRPKIQETFDISQPVVKPTPSYIDLERHLDDNHKEDQIKLEGDPQGTEKVMVAEKEKSRKAEDRVMGRMVDVVLSDMSAPWDQTTGFWKRSLSDPYIRMMNTSGISFKDHAGSMDLCAAALQFGFDTLKTGGHFVVKFYQGSEDKQLEVQLKRLFGSVHREKPDSSRSESKEAYFVALRRKHNVNRESVLGTNQIT
ncbi:FtsJ-like methyltransferase-domain-containing protein [Tricladium varicosporioides]|nr:FtsJ-like methyltransferase-domain-containing protein [Hymenoscyphus varicosporioides]